ncbi:MAG: nitrate- and nitrite sensing domain-containing protein [Planctomycetota bacterium]
MKPLRILHETSLRTKIGLVSAAPVAALCFVQGSAILDNWRTREQATSFSELVTLGVDAGQLVHETQKERGTTALFLAQPDDRFAARLTQQRAATDAARADLVSRAAGAALDEGARSRIQSALDHLDELAVVGGGGGPPPPPPPPPRRAITARSGVKKTPFVTAYVH